MDQSIRFRTTDDGVRIAYATSGKGSPIVRPGHWLTHPEYDLKSPVWRHQLLGLSEQHTLVRYDPRGTGMSDRDVGDISPELWLKDLEAVVSALRLDRFALLGMSQGGPAAIRHAVKHREKVTHLILYGRSQPWSRSTPWRRSKAASPRRRRTSPVNIYNEAIYYE